MDNEHTSSNLSDKEEEQILQSNLQTILGIYTAVDDAEVALSMLELIAKTDMNDDELVLERTPWLVAAVYVVTQRLPDSLIDTVRFTAAFKACRPLIANAVALTFN